MKMARQALLLHKRERSAIIRSLMAKNRLNAPELAEYIHVTRHTITKAASPIRCDQVSLDLLYLIQYCLEFQTWLNPATGMHWEV